MPDNETIDFTIEDESTEQEQQEVETKESTENKLNVVKENSKLDNENNEEIEIESQKSETDYDVRELYKFLKDSGIAPSIDNLEDVKDISDVSNILYKTQSTAIQEGVSKVLEEKTTPYKDLFNYLEKGGNVEDFTRLYNSSFDNISDTMLKDNGNLQNKILFEYYKKTTQWEDDMIRVHLDKYDDDEKAKFSKTALNGLKQIQANNKQQLLQQQEKQNIAFQKQQEEQVNYYKKQLKDLNTIGDLELTVADKNKIGELLFNNTTYDKLSKDFEKYRMNLVVLDHLGLLEDPGQLSKMMTSNKNNKYNFKKKKSSNTTTNGEITFELKEPLQSSKSTIPNFNW